MGVAKTKALISFAVTAKLICVFVFAYAKRWFSRDAAQMRSEICAKFGNNLTSEPEPRCDQVYNSAAELYNTVIVCCHEHTSLYKSDIIIQVRHHYTSQTLT